MQGSFPKATIEIRHAPIETMCDHRGQSPVLATGQECGADARI
jgi:hypothetical protein